MLHLTKRTINKTNLWFKKIIIHFLLIRILILKLQMVILLRFNPNSSWMEVENELEELAVEEPVCRHWINCNSLFRMESKIIVVRHKFLCFSLYLFQMYKFLLDIQKRRFYRNLTERQKETKFWKGSPREVKKRKEKEGR